MNKLKKEIVQMRKAFLLTSIVQFVLFGMYIRCILIPYASAWTFLFAIVMIASAFMCLFAADVLPTKGEEDES